MWQPVPLFSLSGSSSKDCRRPLLQFEASTGWLWLEEVEFSCNASPK